MVHTCMPAQRSQILLLHLFIVPLPLTPTTSIMSVVIAIALGFVAWFSRKGRP